MIEFKESRNFDASAKDCEGDTVARVSIDTLNDDDPIYVSVDTDSYTIDGVKSIIELLQASVDKYKEINK